MAEGTAVAEQTSIAPIEFKGRTIQTYLPNEAQVAVITRITFWDVEAMGKDKEKFRRGVNRIGSLLAGLMVNQEDWDWIEDGMAAREIDWADVISIFSLISDAHGLTNRADRRARKSTGTRARRG